MTPLEQRLRNELGQLTHAHQAGIRQREEMRADLNRQRADMRLAPLRLDRGEVASAVAVLQDALAWRERTRVQRKGRAA